MKDLFISFLKEHNLSYRFIAYYNSNDRYNWAFEEFLNLQNPEHYITEAFSWAKTDEGESFWADMNGCWNKCREKHSNWQYTITFKSKEIDNNKLFADFKNQQSSKKSF